MGSQLAKKETNYNFPLPIYVRMRYLHLLRKFI
jgi:hypothetical protein